MNEKYVLISGAVGGIGKVTVQLLAGNDYKVFAGDKDTVALHSFNDPQIIPLQLDITDSKSIEQAFKEITSVTTELHALINLAGIYDHFALVEADSRTFRKLIDANFTGHQQLTHYAFPYLKKVKGRIINLSSETVLALMPLQAYGFSKKLMDVWNTQLRMELELLDMYVIVIRAGGHQTPFIRQSFDALAKTSGLAEYHPLKQKIMLEGQKMLSKKMSDPQDVAKTIRKALAATRPKKVYYVNVSRLFRLLSLIPVALREKLFIHQLKKWM